MYMVLGSFYNIDIINCLYIFLLYICFEAQKTKRHNTTLHKQDQNVASPLPSITYAVGNFALFPQG